MVGGTIFLHNPGGLGRYIVSLSFVFLDYQPFFQYEETATWLNQPVHEFQTVFTRNFTIWLTGEDKK